MELQQLQHFIALARIGNIGRAADALHITHSGLSRSIKSLEEFLNLPLFERGSRGVTITPYGRALLPRAIHILNERARAINELEALRTLRAGHVEVALHPVFDDNVAPAVLDEFSTLHARVEVDIWSGADPELSARIVQGDFDFAFTLFVSVRDEQALIYEQLFALPVDVYARASHPLADTSVELERLLEAEWVLLGASAFRRAFDEHFRSIGVKPPERIRQCSSIALLRAMVQRRDCLTLLPRFLVPADGNGDLVRLATVMPPGNIVGGLLYRRDSVHSLPALSLMDAFRRGSLPLPA